MAVLNVRVDDHVHEGLKQLADEAGLSLSEYVRELLLEAVVPIRDERAQHGDQKAPESMRLFERQVLAELHRIHARLVPEGGSEEDGDPEYQKRRAEILESGFTGEYWLEVAGFETELSKRDSRRVIDILQMFRVITFSLNALGEEAELDDQTARRLVFRGFDHNDGLEGHMARYVAFMMRDGRHWTELQPQIEANDDGNSHMQMLDVYSRMLAEYRRIMDSRERRFASDAWKLTRDDLQRVADAAVHPSRR
jgi:uncharacterized protein